MYLPSMRASLAVINMDDITTPGSRTESKPPLPPPSSAGNAANDPAQPRPPPRTRPKSWTSSLFNAMKSNHKSINFQSVLEEQQDQFGAEQASSSSASSKLLYMAKSSGNGNDDETVEEINDESERLRLPKTRSRTPSPFRNILKGLVKGTFDRDPKLIDLID